MAQNCLKSTTPSLSTGVRTHGCAILLASRWSRNLREIGNINANNIKIVVENANLCEKNMQHAHFAEMCKKCGNKRNMRQSHIHIELTWQLALLLLCLVARADEWVTGGTQLAARGPLGEMSCWAATKATGLNFVNVGNFLSSLLCLSL